MPLITAPNFDAGDDFYEALLSAHHGLDVDASHAFNARLILLLANHIGRQDVLLDALSAAARANPVPPVSPVHPASIDAPTPGDASPRGQA
ncbi:DUF2783 domain-containing protein [Mitsuaria sp. 7]|uniref:DUF2783 domain-containing protein n=1 Tax=Mitsuaria sp. 7 TaxID=1658665 RepID=UPI0007DCD660|nr:DUF2783 domain-containing protein [Mitsuaria sp. 7]ANH66384.1 hypothetical protein ABE85_00300 [Mitsuaria sp. 7]